MSKKNKEEKLGFLKYLKEETVHGVFAIIFFVLAIFFVLSAFNKAGIVGRETYKIFQMFVGAGYFLIPLILLTLSFIFLKSLKKQFALVQTVGAFIFLFSSLGITNIISGNGGWIGWAISAPLEKLFDIYTSIIILSALLIISILVIFDASLKFDFLWVWSKIFRKKNAGQPDVNQKEVLDEKEVEKINQKTEEENASAEEANADKNAKPLKIKKPEDGQKSDMIMFDTSFGNHPYTPPPLSLLEQDKGKPGVGDIKANANIIKRTLLNFGIAVEMDEITIGPSVTRYAIKPAEGVKLSKIVALQDNLAYALAAHPIRIEAPIPGKSLVGIEIPNSTKTTVGLGTLLSSEEYKKQEKPLLVSLGKGISGKCHFGNLGKMPHLLIAGATGSGKSVTIHTIITSLLYRNSPDNLKFIMIDPKRVELTLYNKIPHLLTPVVTDAKKTILALKWAAKEMDRRYDILEAESVRDIESYHKNIVEPELKKNNGKTSENESKLETMPYIVIIIDELADIMQSYPRELESAIVRLAQMSRAVGIHLILSTQRPSVNVITGLIKANIPTRIALQVASQIDSRTILDTGGAEKLLGAGDMLYLSGDMSKPLRIQSAFISENEVKNIVKYLTNAYKDELPGEIDMVADNSKNPIFETSITDDADSMEEDDLYEEAREIIISAGKASTSYLQRKLRIGYARAARLIDMLEDRGVIGHADGAKPREVIDGQTEDTVPENQNESGAEVSEETNLEEEEKQ